MTDASDRVLSAVVVDNDAIIRMDACQMLMDFGYEAHEAETGDLALSALRSVDGQMDLLFTDVDMPGSTIDGFALARKVSQCWPRVGILVASGKHQPKDGDMPDGAVFVPKPFSAEVVRHRLKELLPPEKQTAEIERD